MPSARQARSIASRAPSSRRKTIASPHTAPARARRKRQQDTRAVARLAVGSDRAAVTDVVEPLERAVDDLARGAALRVGDEADAAGVALGALLVAEVVHRCPLQGSEVRKKRAAWTIDLAGVAENGAPASA